MTAATVALCNVSSLDGRIFFGINYRRLTNGVLICLGTVAAVCALITTVMVAAAWIVKTAFAANPYIHAHPPTGLRMIGVANYGPTLTSGAELSRSARVSIARADVPVMTFEAKWARATAFGPIDPVPERPVERSDNMLPSHSSNVLHSESNSEISRASNQTDAFTRTAPAVPTTSPLPTAPALPQTLTSEQANTVPLPRPHPSNYEMPVDQDAAASEKRVAHNKSISSPAPDSRTALYDIAAHTVYLPNGDRLEAHSGLGSMLDNPRYVEVKRRGPTPPNVYHLTLRERLFHGVRAIRLTPVEDDKMFGRDGMLAHSYLLGPSGQSNGCVSFKDYRKFLQAFLRGQVDRLVVVPDLGSEHSRTARARRGRVGQYAFNSR